MSENKPYLNARLRNPFEDGGMKPVSKPDWIGGAVAVVAVVVAVVTLAILFLDYQGFSGI